MIALIQRLLQILVIAAVGYFIWKPQAVPLPAAQPFFVTAQRLIFGEQVSWQSFAAVWNARWKFVVAYLPGLQQWARSIPSEPPEITADSLVNFFMQALFRQPLQKWEQIKHDAMQPASESAVASPSADGL